MTEQIYSSLVFNTSPKTSKRTTFQDELEAAVKNRVFRYASNDYNDDDDDDDEDDEDDVLRELLKTRRRKISMFKASRTKTSISDFKLSEEEEEEENIRPKKVSFLKNQRNSHTLTSHTLTSDTLTSDTLTSDTVRSERSLLSHQTVPEAPSHDRNQQHSEFTSHSQSPAQSNSQSESLTARNSKSESTFPFYSENSQWKSSFDCMLEATPPTPAPRQRSSQWPIGGCDETDGQTQTPSSRPAPLPLSKTSSNNPGNCGRNDREDDVVTLNTHSPSLQETDNTVTGAVVELRCQEKEQLGSEVCPEPDPRRVRSSSSRPGSSRRSRTSWSYSAIESRYLGMLKVLEQTSCLQETELDTADSLRATVYQNWLKKKEKKLQATFRAKNQEEKQKEEKKNEEENNKKAEAKASYEAWKEKKQEALREKIKGKQEETRKLQKETEDKNERKETAKQVFEKWKRERDVLLHEQRKKQQQTAMRVKEKKEKEKEERKRESSSSFTQWSERKKEVIEEKMKTENRKEEIKVIEEKYEKEEREKTALEMYEKWLNNKKFQEYKERRDKKMKVVEEALPPWSPPNRTVPYGK